MDEKNIESGVAKVVGAPEASPVAAHAPADATKLVTPGSSSRRPSRAAAANAKEILSGKRERELFDPDEARREAAAKRAAAAAERERAEEEMIARWKEEDRLKAEAAREKAVAEGTAGAEDGAEEGADGDTNTAPNGAPEDGSAPSTSTLAGRSKRGASATAADRRPTGRREIPLPPPPPEPTQPYTPPLTHISTHISDGRQAKGSSRGSSWPVFGCDACDYNRHGCYACLMGPPVRSAYKPDDAHHYDVPSVPVYHPTEEEWANDPLEYINKIRPEAERYGVCNIVCPPSWQPEFRLPNKDELRFRTRIQAVNELQDRPAGPSKRARENAARARAALEAAGIDPATFPPGFLLGGGAGGGGRMGGNGGRMGGGGGQKAAPAPDTPPGSAVDDDERANERAKSSEPASKEATPGPGDSNPNNPTNPAVANKKKKPPPGPSAEAEEKKAEAILAQYGFTSGERHTVKTLERYSDYFKRKYFSRPGGVPANVTIRDLEGEFWRLVESPAGRSVEVIYGADIATMEVGSGLTNKDDPCDDNPDQLKYATSPWNVCNMPYNPSSCLKHVEATTGITVPWLYFGMTLSTFCWHVEDHHFYSVNYHHFGDPKVWYSIPAAYSEKFEEVMRRRLPHLFNAQPDLLHSLVTILSPKVLRDEGIPVYRAEQHPRSYIITFPYAYHAGFNTGFNCAEAVNFAPVDWLPYGAVATEQYVRDRRYQSVAHDQLLATLCDACEERPSHCATVAAVMRERVEREKERRAAAVPSRVGNSVRMAGTDEAPDLFERDCHKCQADLNWAGVRCECKPKRLYCLRCVKECGCGPHRSTMFYRHTGEELDAKCARLEELAREAGGVADRAVAQVR